jgi:hypothetical protein
LNDGHWTFFSYKKNKFGIKYHFFLIFQIDHLIE